MGRLGHVTVGVLLLACGADASRDEAPGPDGTDERSLTDRDGARDAGFRADNPDASIAALDGTGATNDAGLLCTGEEEFMHEGCSVEDTGLPDAGSQPEPDAGEQPDAGGEPDAGSDDACPGVGCDETEPCGNGELDADEACDLGADNGAQGSCCTADCAFVAAGTTCRAGTGDLCDPDEACTGEAAECPEDAWATADQVCRPSSDSCDPAESCTGVAGASCPEDIVRSADPECTSCPIVDDVGVLNIVITTALGHPGLSQQWQIVSTDLGHTSTVLAADALATQDLSGFDVLIVSSGVDVVPPSLEAVVDSFISTGRGVYLQTEYDCSGFTANGLYQSLVASYGGTMTFAGPVSGDHGSGSDDTLVLSGCVADGPEPVEELPYFWYACGAAVTGPGHSAWMHVVGEEVAWSYCNPAAGGGHLLTTTDQDWVLQAPVTDATAAPTQLMRNIIQSLGVASACGG
ncbi:MAG: hypothetical protein OXT09_16555 [Myxococcales bacterium]|nr:hypothetical protein [Myxococcales bacterium]